MKRLPFLYSLISIFVASSVTEPDLSIWPVVMASPLDDKESEWFYAFEVMNHGPTNLTMKYGESVFSRIVEACPDYAVNLQCDQVARQISMHLYGIAYVPSLPTARLEDFEASRTTVIVELARRFNYQSYLEIGCFLNQNFVDMKTMFQVAECTDPASGGTHRLTSDEYFAQNQKSFDLIFIDGMHEAYQVVRDFENSLRFLNPGGTIVLHDCHPTHEMWGTFPKDERAIRNWQGDQWRVIVAIAAKLSDVDVVLVDVEHGLAVARRRVNPHRLSEKWTSYLGDHPIEKLDWTIFQDHRRELMHFVTLEGLRRWLDEEVGHPEIVTVPSNSVVSLVPRIRLALRSSDQLLQFARILPKRAVLDRSGVSLVEDVDVLREEEELCMVPAALAARRMLLSRFEASISLKIRGDIEEGLFRSWLVDHLAVFYLFSFSLDLPLVKDTATRVAYLHCSISRLIENVGHRTKLHVYVWLSATASDESIKWLTSILPREVMILRLPECSWTLPSGVGNFSLWLGSDRFPRDYYIMGNWRLAYGMRFLQLMGYEYFLQIDDDTFVLEPIDEDIVESFRSNFTLLGVRDKFLIEASEWVLGLSEFSRFWMQSRRISAPIGPLLENTMTTAFDNEAWNRRIFAGCFVIWNVDFWFQDVVQDFVIQVVKSGSHVQLRWQEQGVMNMVRLLLTPSRNTRLFSQRILHTQLRPSRLFNLQCDATQKQLSIEADHRAPYSRDRVSVIVFLQNLPKEAEQVDWHFQSFNRYLETAGNITSRSPNDRKGSLEFYLSCLCIYSSIPNCEQLKDQIVPMWQAAANAGVLDDEEGYDYDEEALHYHLLQ